MEIKYNYYSYDLKIKVINLKKNFGYSVLELVKLFNISKSSIYSWLKFEKENGLINKNKTKYIKNNSIFRNINLRNFIFSYITINSNFS